MVGRNGRREASSRAHLLVECYSHAADADNHAVREAAAQCIAEMAQQLEREAVAPHVDTLVATLLRLFGDGSWPVRDCACRAAGAFVCAFPQQSKPALAQLMPLWLAHLHDNIGSVREHAAVALAQALAVYGGDVYAQVLDELDRALPGALEQPSVSTSHSKLQSTTKFGVAGAVTKPTAPAAAPAAPADSAVFSLEAKRMRDNDLALHNDAQTFSCGSLAPRLKRGGGCMDHGFARDTEAWERTDGAVYLLREVTGVVAAKPHDDDDKLNAGNERVRRSVHANWLPLIAKIAALRHFAHYPNLLEVCFEFYLFD